MKHTVPQEIFSSLPGVGQGLSLDEVANRQATFGLNHVTEKKRRAWLDLVLDTAKDPMIWFLLISGTIYLFVGETLEAWVLWGSILPLLGMDAFLHRRIHASTAGLSRRLASHATVTRGGKTFRILSAELVPGDTIEVGTGEFIPADGLLREGTGIQVDESSLTGEAYPVEKTLFAASSSMHDKMQVEESSWGFAGTRVLTGKAVMQVIFTGERTLYGQIVRSAIDSTKTRTPLQKAISRLVATLLVAAAFLCVLLAYVRFRQGYGWLDAFVSAATLAVAAIPEEFPVVFTIFLGVGIFRLAHHKALVRRSVCVENIGRVSTICVDKTGTLTEGQLRWSSLAADPKLTENRLLEIAALASRSESRDPLDEAILAEVHARHLAVDAHEVLEIFPFTEDRRRETAVVRTADGNIMVATKGSPEVVLDLCNLSQAERASWENKFLTLGSQGQKIIACAYTLLQDHQNSEPKSAYQFAGLLAFEDPVRPGVKEAVAQCQAAGIHVVMITGDHPATALAIAHAIGLGGDHPVLRTGADLKTDPVKNFAGLRRVHIVARVLPAQKLEIVRKLQSEGEVVAVTGDGVNDVPALQGADISIAMGERGVQSAREISDIVLLDENFRNIVRAISEGRQLFFNLKNSFTYLLLIHIPLVLTATLIPIMGFPLLYLPIHIIWLEAIIHPTAILGFQQRRALELAPQIGSKKLLFYSGKEWFGIALCGTIATLAILGLYHRSLGSSHDIAHARAMALVFLTMFSGAAMVFLNRLSNTASRILFSVTLISTVILVQIPFLSRLFHMRPLHSDDWLLALVIIGVMAALASLFSSLTKKSNQEMDL